MNQIAKSRVALLLSGLFAAAVPLLAGAASPPNAGNLLDTVRDKDFTPTNKSEPGIEIQQEAPKPRRADNGSAVKVSAFHITGNTVLTEAELQSRIASSIGRELTMSDLGGVADEISRYYRSKGYFVARAYLPAQEIKDGVVEIAVLEGRIGNVGVKVTGEGRLAESSVQQTIDGAVKQGDVISERHLERGLLLANDLAGVSVDSTLVPGASVGTSDLVVEAKRTPGVSGGIDYDNSGNKFTGSSRVGASLNIGNVLGDQISLRALTSGSDMNYGRVSYLLPVGSHGTKIGAAYSSMHYKLGNDFSSLNADGNADIGSLYAIHPIVRSRNCNLYGQLGYDDKHLTDNANGQQTDDKHNRLYTAGLSGDWRDGLGGGGMNSYGVTYYGGSLGLDSKTAALDSIGAQANGSYSKTSYNFLRMQRLNDDFSLYAALSGQTASKNLDSSEKFVLGGAGGVRSYPQGEASGDEGELLNIELRKQLNNNFQVVGFYDFGHIQLNRNTWTNWQGTNPSLQNSYSLAGAGLGLNFSKAGSSTGGYSVKAYIASRIGSNPGRDINGRDSDGTNNSTRFWLQANKWF